MEFFFKTQFVLGQTTIYSDMYLYAVNYHPDFFDHPFVNHPVCVLLNTANYMEGNKKSIFVREIKKIFYPSSGRSGAF